MSLSASLNAGVQGLNVNSTRLSTISDNIVNANTNGYKRTLTEFSSVVVQGDVQNSYTAGGVRAYVKRDVASIGSLESTSNETDVAVSGAGFIPVSPTTRPEDFDPSSSPVQLTPTGSFEEDAEGFLIDVNGRYMLGWALNADGTTVVGQPSRNSFSDLEAVNARLIKYNAVETSSIKLSGPIPASATKVGASGDPFTHKEEYFDTIGNTQALTYTFTPIVPTSGTSNTWRLEVNDTATTANSGLIGSYTLVFNSANSVAPGTIASVTPTTSGTPAVADAAGTFDALTGELLLPADSATIKTFIGEVGVKNGITQTGSTESANIRLDFKDGAGYGEYKGVRVDENGVVSAYFTNDQSRPIYKIPIATVSNPNALEAVGGQAYRLTVDAGSLSLADSGALLAGKIVGYALTKSSVDVAQELTGLIETQRAYSSNAKIIQTVDEMLQETTNLKR